MRKKRNHRRNFADETAIDTVLSAANLVTMLDPDKMTQDNVELVADVTNTSEEFVDEMLDIVDESNSMEVAGYDEPAIIENYSNKSKKVVENFSANNPRKKRKSRNFSDKEVMTDAVAEAVEVVSLLDEDTLECCTAEDIAETISDVTEVPVEILEPVIELAQDNFSLGKKKGLSYSRKLNKKKLFAAAAEPDKIEPITHNPDVAPTTVDTNEVVAQKLDDKEVVQTSENDPKPGEPTSDPINAGQAMALANDLMIVENIADVPNNYSNKDKRFSNLKTILGDKYVPNE